jgi:hypothetical protein
LPLFCSDEEAGGFPDIESQPEVGAAGEGFFRADDDDDDDFVENGPRRVPAQVSTSPPFWGVYVTCDHYFLRFGVKNRRFT